MSIKPFHPNLHPPGHFEPSKHTRDATGKFAGKSSDRDGHGAGPTKGNSKPSPATAAPGFGGGLGAANSSFGQMVGD